MLHVFSSSIFGHLGGESFRISLFDLLHSLNDCFLVALLVEAVLAATFNAAHLSICKALAVQLQALRLGACTLLGSLALRGHLLLNHY